MYALFHFAMKSVIIENNYYGSMVDFIMEEKAYKTMGCAGVANLIIGICILAGAVTSGILLIVQGARLLHNRKNILI